MLLRFILRKKPHVIVIGGESREALTIKVDVSECVQQLVEDEQFPRIPIEIADNHISKIYSNSIRGRVSLCLLGYKVKCYDILRGLHVAITRYNYRKV